MKRGNCAYCGELRDLTRDHIPPKCLFGSPRPSNLITVPSCNPCNRELSKDDEYFRLVLTLGIDQAKFPKESSESIRAINSLSRPSSLGFAVKLQRSYRRDPARLEVEKSRVNIVMHRIARGLFYHHSGVRLPQAVPFECRILDDLGDVSTLGKELITGLEQQVTTIGDGKFRYSYNFKPWSHDDPFETMWLMRFYEHRTFFCMTASR